MRALCGAIITAGALIGLGLAAMGAGYRYHGVAVVGSDKNSTPVVVRLSEMDHPLLWTIIFLTIVAVIGLAIAFLGLAYHHHRRHHEMLRDRERAAAAQRTTV